MKMISMIALLAFVGTASASLECYHNCTIFTKFEVDDVDMMATMANFTKCDASLKKTCADGEVCAMFEVEIESKMDTMVNGKVNSTQDVDLKAKYSECSEKYSMSDESCKEVEAGFEVGLNDEEEYKFHDLKTKCGKVDNCKSDCLMSGAVRSVLPASLLVVAVLIARLA